MLTSLTAHARATLAAFVMLIGLAVAQAAEAADFTGSFTAGDSVDLCYGHSIGSGGPYSVQFNSGSMPPGLSFVFLNPGSVCIRGNATQTGLFSFHALFYDGSNTEINQATWDITITAPNLLLGPPSGPLTSWNANTPGYSVQLTGGGGNAPRTYALASGALPAGLTLSNTGLISGTPTGTGTFNFGVTMTDSTTGSGAPYSVTNAYSITIAPEPTLFINDVTAAEGNSGITVLTFNVLLSSASTSTVTVNYVTADGTALAGSDYLSASGTLTFPPGVTTMALDVLVNGDTVFENNETFFVNLTAPTNATIADAQGQGTIQNDDAAPTLTINDVTASEGAGTMTFTVTRTGATGLPVAVNFATANGTATSPADYIATSGSLTFAPSLAATATQTVSVPLANDNVYEAAEQFAVDLTAPTNATIADGQGIGTITDDDPAPAIAVNDVTVNEGDGSAVFTFTLTGATALPINVNYGTANGTAVALQDYYTTSGWVTFPASMSATQTRTINVALIDDSIFEPTEQFAVNIFDPTNGATISDAQGIATITDDDSAPTLSIDDVTLAEGNAGTTNFVFTVTLTGASAQTTTVSYDTADGTATAGSDYSMASGTLTFAPGLTTRTVSVPVSVAGDTAFETDETFFVNLTLPTNATIADGQGIGTIQNDDAAVAISPAAGALPGAQAATEYTQQLTVTGGNGGPYTISLSAGALPPGLSLSPAGLISGTLTATGTYNFSVTASDTASNTGSAAYSITVNAPTIMIAPPSLPNATQFSAYSQPLTASGGNAPYTFSVTSGALPDGLSLNPTTGELAGTPTGFGSFTFTATATDSTSGGTYSGSRAYTLAVNQAQPTIASVAPNLGPTAGGQSVTITGTNFANASTVSFGGTAAGGFTVNSPTSITATTPAHASGTVDVTVTTPGGTATATNGYVYENPGAVRFVVNSGDDDGSFVFSSLTTGLNFTIATSGGAGQSADIGLAPGNYSLSFTTPAGFGIASASCSPSGSTVNASAKTASLAIASNVTTVCTIEALGSRRATTEMIGAALDASSRLILSNAPALSRRLDRLNGRGGAGGTASAFGKTFASNLPFSASLSEGQFTFAMSLSDLRARADADHRFKRPDGVPASLAASAEPAAGLAATSAAAATTQLDANRVNRFDIWVEGMIAQFDGAASSDGDFAIVHAGMDYLVTDDVLVGVAIQGDWLNMDTASGSLDSSGWLAGPYLTARVSDGLYLDLRAAWGGATFDVSPFGTYTDSVDSDRALYSAALIGQFTSGTLTIRPEARVTWYKEVTDAYVDSLSVAIPSVEIKTGEVTFGPTFEWTIEQASGALLKPSLGFDLVWTFQQDNTATAFTGAPGLDDTGVRGRIEGGLGWQSENGVSLGGSLFYDGIGGGDYEAWGGKAAFRVGF